tara:strand:+ start:343 stop:561 length:219 start_codon:yes stop_codon:yes gene_type:complete
MEHISATMRYAGKKLALCDHFCAKRMRNTQFFHWFALLDKRFIKTMCITCALREAWGYAYKSNKHYKKWIAG